MAADGKEKSFKMNIHPKPNATPLRVKKGRPNLQLKPELLPHVIDARDFYEAEALATVQKGKRRVKLEQLKAFDMLMLAYQIGDIDRVREVTGYSSQFNLSSKLKCIEQRVELYLKIKEREK